MRLKSPASQLCTQLFVQAEIKENIKAPRHWPLWEEFTSDRWIPRTKGQQRGKCFHLMTSSAHVLLHFSNTDMCWNFNRPPSGAREEVVVIAMDVDLAADADRVEIYDGRYKIP